MPAYHYDPFLYRNTSIYKVSKDLVLDVLNYKKGFSKGVIRKLGNHFKLNQEAFNRSHALKVNTVIDKG